MELSPLMGATFFCGMLLPFVPLIRLIVEGLDRIGQDVK